MKLFEPLHLPNGAVIANRLCKAAMEENLCDPGQVPGERLYSLYKQWSAGGAGLILTGNVMVAPDALTGPGGVVLQDDSSLARFEQWAQIGRANGAHFWMQINHPGRQVYAAMGETALAPSAIPVSIPGFEKLFAKPRSLGVAEIEQVIQRFANTAVLAEQAGFTGVEVHAAHGYLLSQFLSPLTNLREDEWGGSLANRARLLFRVVQAIRARVSSGFCVAVKLNSADFQKGGFAPADALWVVEQLNSMQVDLVELSGGSYESPAMQGGEDERTDLAASTLQREAYFVEFAQDIAAIAKMPVMVTGGIRKPAVAEQAVATSNAGFAVSMVGMARAMAFRPDLPKRWQQGERTQVSLPQIKWKNKTLAALAVMAVTKSQLNRMALGQEPKFDISPLFALLADRLKTRWRTRRYRKWRRAEVR